MHDMLWKRVVLYYKYKDIKKTLIQSFKTCFKIIPQISSQQQYLSRWWICFVLLCFVVTASSYPRSQKKRCRMIKQQVNNIFPPPDQFFLHPTGPSYWVFFLLQNDWVWVRSHLCCGIFIRRLFSVCCLSCSVRASCCYTTASAWLDTKDRHDSPATLLATQTAAGNKKRMREMKLNRDSVSMCVCPTVLLLFIR